MRLIDADKLCEEFKTRQRAALRWKEKAILFCDEEKSIRADATLAFLSEVKLTIDKAPTFEDRDIFNMGYFEGKKIASERKRGEWISHEADDLRIGDFQCNQCKHYQDDITNFCPNCGADMRENDNE